MEKVRTIQEYVPGKQVTMAHIIANPDKDLYKKLGINGVDRGSFGILTITPCEAAIIAADTATKSGDITIGFLDRFTGSLILTGDVSSVESAVQEILLMLENTLGFTVTKITKS